jgi:hypothetical protein
MKLEMDIGRMLEGIAGRYAGRPSHTTASVVRFRAETAVCLQEPGQSSLSTARGHRNIDEGSEDDVLDVG